MRSTGAVFCGLFLVSLVNSCLCLTCKSTADCAAPNSACVGHSCQCQRQYVEDAHKSCVMVSWSGEIRVSVVNSSTINVTWDPPHPDPGHTEYDLYVAQKQSNGRYKQHLHLHETEYHYTSVTVSHLPPFSYQKLTLNVSSDRYHNEAVRYIVSPPADPGKITLHKDFDFHREWFEIRWSITPQLMTQGLKFFFLTYQIEPSPKVYQIEKTTSERWRARIIFVPESKYIIKIHAQNYIGADGPTTVYVMRTGKGETPTAPPKPPIKPPMITHIDGGAPTTLVLNIRTLFFRDESHGKIIDFGLIVSSNLNDYLWLSPHSPRDYRNYETWFNVSNEFQYHPYRATPLNWTTKRGFTKSINFTVGSENCDNVADKLSFCNGKLWSSSQYYVKAFSCTNGGCAETKYFGPYKTQTDPGLHAIVVVFSVVLVLLLLSVIIALTFVCRKRRDETSDNRALMNAET